MGPLQGCRGEEIPGQGNGTQEAPWNSSLNQSPGYCVNPWENRTRQASWKQRLLPEVCLSAPRQAQWTSSLQAACSTTCFLAAATLSERVFTARQTSLQRLPVWLTWRKRPTVRGLGLAEKGGSRAWGWAGLKPSLVCPGYRQGGCPEPG